MAPRIRRTEVHWVDLGAVVGSEQGGRRPILVLQDNIINERSSTTIGVVITSRRQQLCYPLALELAAGEGACQSALGSSLRS